MTAVAHAADQLDTLDLLAADHDAHLGWLAARFPASLSAEDREDVLQEAYTRALQASASPAAPSLPDAAARQAWFRRLAANAAVDALRARDGRRRPGLRAGELRPRLVADDEALASIADEHSDVEAAALAAAERDHAGTVVERALATLDGRHQRILRWRFHDGLSPETICRLEGLSGARQYEGRLRRALAALRPALAGVHAGPGCAEARALMGSQRGRELDVHLAACVPCRAFDRRLRGALGALPLPLLAGQGLLGRVRDVIAALGTAKAAAGAAAVTAIVATAGVGLAPRLAETPAAGRAPAAAVSTPSGATTPAATATATVAPRRDRARAARKRSRPAHRATPTPTAVAARTAVPSATAAPSLPTPAPTPKPRSAFAEEFQP